MGKLTLTPTLKMSEKELLLFRGISKKQVEQLLEVWGSSAYEMLCKVDTINLEISDSGDLFINHTYGLFSDIEFNELLENESTSEYNVEEGYWETQILNE
jgi:hypothetical protein